MWSCHYRARPFFSQSCAVCNFLLLDHLKTRVWVLFWHCEGNQACLHKALSCEPVLRPGMPSSHCLLVLAKGAAAFSSPVSIYLSTNNSVMTMGGNNLAVKIGKKLLLIELKNCRCLDCLAWLQPACFLPPLCFAKCLDFLQQIEAFVVKTSCLFPHHASSTYYLYGWKQKKKTT